jgi:hypothetical protein
MAKQRRRRIEQGNHSVDGAPKIQLISSLIPFTVAVAVILPFAAEG